MDDDKIRAQICAQVIQLLKEERARQGISMKQLARLTGLTQPAISLLESRPRNPKLDTLLRMSRALGVELGKILLRASKTSEQVANQPESSKR